MHHSDHGSRKAAVITLYLDESGTDDLSPTAVVGGLLLNRPGFLQFHREWRKMLKRHGIPYVHMKAFQRHGKLGGLSVEERRAIFVDVVDLINLYKIRSLAATLTPEHYKRHFESLFDMKKEMSVYGMCFILSVAINHQVADLAKYKKTIPFLMDEGNTYAEHVRVAHLAMRTYQKTSFIHLGSLTFGDDEVVLPLQAADVISWAVRRRLVGHDLPEGFEPLLGVFNGAHVDAPFQEHILAELATRFRAHFGVTLNS